ncbi:MAG TPA: DEAD/DEAH box helicase, partial [Cellvibrionaceae bacterium]|nr:DEAD/DEAH box helicase [Cellvibrionaceae bacterium]
MLPSLLTRDIQQGIKQFLITGFEPSDPFFSGLMQRFVEDESAWMKGPYLQLGLPFRPGQSGRNFFSEFETENAAYIHQEAAWNRLASNKLAANTLVATGTGSGKTECFLFPLLDHVLRANKAGEKGIKALVIYPMNALASDQARRFAEVISQTSTFAGMRVGLFVGGQKSATGDGMMMTRDEVIYDQDVLRSNPPDILLTNYKMLDYLLIRPKDRKLWRHNTPQTLRYLVVDELHTFDGAQGTDLAMLIRRLRARLQIPDKHLICAGTSATLGGSEGMAPLCEYAGQIFAEEFTSDSVVTENRKSVAEFLADAPIEYFINWDEGLVQLLDHTQYATQQEAVKVWFNVFFPELPAPENVNQPEWRRHLSGLLKRHVLFSNLMKKAKGDVIPFAELHADLRGLSEAARKHITRILDALLVLVAWARNPEIEKLPLLNLRTQLWMRELRRMVTNVTPNASDVRLYSDKDLPGERSELFLPLIQCTNCHSSAWLSRLPGTTSKVSHNLEEIYNGWFAANPDVVRLYPHKGFSKQLPIEGVEQILCADCGHLQSQGAECSSCGSDRLINVFRTSAVRSTESGQTKINYHDDTCPDCGSRNRLILLGARSATLGAQVVEQTWSSPFNDDKKLIAFSDSVQDAAHRAGFFTARTYANTTRTAIAKVIDHIGQAAIPWTSFLQQLETAWTLAGSPIFMPRERFVAEFIGPNMLWQKDWTDELLRHETLPHNSKLPWRVQRRLAWQAVSEFTYLSQRGRNLDRIGKATLAPDVDHLRTAITKLIPVLQNKLGLHNLDERAVFYWLWGFLTQLRRRGAVTHPLLGNYMEDGNLFAFIRHANEWLPPMSNRTPHPIFITTGNHRDFDRLTKGSRKTWYVNWFDACLGNSLVLTQKGICEAVYEEAVGCLSAEGILTVCESDKLGKTIGINAEALNLYTNPSLLFTQDKKRRLTVPAEAASLLVGMPCLDSVSIYYTSIGEPDSWLRDRFSSGDLRRVIAAEHTGLLQREERETLESRFKHQHPQPWYENLLSATPTLEMGVDIGSLSSVLLCSVPPNQASYLQRIGRAGRRDGNAMTTTLADGTSPHDLYFFAEPEEMLSGDVTPPGIFLQAPEVLRRQLMAFCMDDWVASGIAEAALPDKTSLVLTAIEKLDEKRFPFLLKNYMELHEARLLPGFIGLLGKTIPEPISARITDYFRGSEQEKSIIVRLFEVFENLQKEKTQQKKRADAIKEKLTALAKQPKDEAIKSEIEQLQRERDSALAIIREIDQRELLNTLADEGLIPNYAFPEAGVELKSILWRKKASDEVSENNYIALPALKYERPAASALSEFAPENRFYANQRRVEIDQINMSLSKPETWRLCPSCQHMEKLDAGDNHEMCPKCGDLMWKNLTQKRSLLRFKQAIANSDDTKVRIDDSAEEREPKFYERQLLAEFDIQHVKHAWRLNSNSMP